MSVITKLYIYPIKSCRGIARQTLHVSAGGVDDDRCYMVVDEYGKFITARTEPTLLLVELLELDGGFLARAPDGEELRLERGMLSADERQAAIWSDTTRAFRHAAGSDFFTRYLGKTVSLVHLPEAQYRRVDPKLARPDDRVAFADAYPLLLTSEASLTELNSRLKASGAAPLTMERFRPNIVLDGERPHEEDELRDFQLGDLPFSMPKLCERCVMTTYDPQSAERGAEPLKTLATYRKWDGKVWFGANVLIRGSGVLRLGQPLKT